MKSEHAAWFGSDDFKNRYHYDGDDLGVRYTPERSSFRVWAPTAEAVAVCLYDDGLQGAARQLLPLRQDRQGTWVGEAEGDWKGRFYTFRASFGGRPGEEAVDPYARAVGANGERGMIVNLGDTHPSGWENDRRPAFIRDTDAVIYELHVRDLSSHESSRIQHQGLFLGLTERGVRSPLGEATGLDHLVELGITHLHLLPVFDYCSVDETQSHVRQFNWGYDPKNYNTPEGSYATNPYDGTVRIREFKQAIQALHHVGIRVVMDVVYNHTGATDNSFFNRLVPGYYYRQDANGEFSNGSACGNETASERSMVRKFIVDSVAYWAREYHVDGFRFDLMGLHDIETMNAVRAALDAIDPTIMIYGEGWTASVSPLPDERKALKGNVARLNRIAVFSDDLRDALKGSVWEKTDRGFVNGREGLEERIKFGVVAALFHPQIDFRKVTSSSQPWAAEPHHCVNYASAHDNHTLWDKICLASPGESEIERIKMDKLCAAIVLTAQGIAFLHAGEEMLRTKQGHENSYNQPDEINQLDWIRKSQYKSVCDYYRGLIALRRAHPAFRMPTAQMIRECLSFTVMPAPNMVGFVLGPHAHGDAAERIIVVYNANVMTQTVALSPARWAVLADGERAGTEPLRYTVEPTIQVSGRSALVLATA